MSRSYKKNPVLKYAPIRGKWEKKAANHRVRRCADVPDGKGYRKVFPTWDIHDCYSRYSLSDAFDSWTRQTAAYLLLGLDIETIHQMKNRWQKYYYRK